MELTLSQLSLLIELTEREITQLKQIINDSSSSEEEVDNCGELSIQYLALSARLAELYKENWSIESGQPAFEVLIEDIHNSQ
ncbi:MAG TPA: hypothetical protein PKC70_00490 [Cellvibrionaceae bacterium]|nr:hypothetical protein [Cellvibrionaceae bacterium]